MRLLGLADWLRDAGLRVVEVSGWQQRGWEPFNPRGLVAHHTAGRCNSGSLAIVTDGRRDLPGPLAQLLLACDGTYYVIASGRANHAGGGGWRGLSGNSSVVGIEAEHPGRSTVPWPAVQLDAYYCGIAVICRKLGFSEAMVCGHKEWAPSRKVDPIALDMDAFRMQVADRMRGSPTLPPSPATEDDDMLMFWHGDGVYLVLGGKRTPIGIHAVDVDALKAKGVPLLGRRGQLHMFYDMLPVTQ